MPQNVSKAKKAKEVWRESKESETKAKEGWHESKES
jgi:hypothetical protein